MLLLDKLTNRDLLNTQLLLIKERERICEIPSHERNDADWETTDECLDGIKTIFLELDLRNMDAWN